MSRSARAPATAAAQGDEDAGKKRDEVRARLDAKGTATQADLARRFNVSRSTISRIHK